MGLTKKNSTEIGTDYEIDEPLPFSSPNKPLNNSPLAKSDGAFCVSIS